MAVWSISRVLYLTVINLTYRLLYSFSGVFNIHGEQPYMNILTLLRVGFTWTEVVADLAVSSCLAFSSLLTTQGYSGYFLLHFPSSRLDLPLASTLLYEARTFLKLDLTSNLRPSDQADTTIIASKNYLSIPIFKIFCTNCSHYDKAEMKFIKIFCHFKCPNERMPLHCDR